MNITHLQIDHVPAPLGFALDKPRISWTVEDTPSRKQTAARVTVALDSGFRTIAADSGASAEISSLGYTPVFTPAPRTRYYVRVEVWGDGGDTACGQSWFETGKHGEAWTAVPVTAPEAWRQHHLYARKSFELTADIASARLYVCGLGLYEAEINGGRVGSEYLTPGYNDYDAWLQIQTYDVTPLLRRGGNALGLHLGKGWYRGRFGCHGKNEDLYGDRLRFIAELHVLLTNGEQRVIASDTSWLCHPSHILDSGIYDGETLDLRRRPKGWSSPFFEEEGWQPMMADGEFPTERLQDRRSLPMVVHETRPVTLLRTPKGEMVLDAGQNMTGWLRFRLNAPEGTAVRLSYGEVLQDDCFYRDNLRSAKAEYTVISDGAATVCEPAFTYYGFRYVKVEGLDSVNPDDFTALVVYSDMETTGRYETSHPLVNRLIQNAFWSLRGNFLDVPTDCPQRDERMGWTGDAQIFCGTALYLTDAAAFYHKYLYDLRYEQTRYHGSVPFTIPSKGLSGGHGAAAWSDAATVIPWELYRHTGDKDALAAGYDSMRSWVDYIHSRDEAGGGRRLWTGDHQFGDWLSLDAIHPKERRGGTDVDYIASAFYVLSAVLTAKAARVLGHTADALYYEGLAKEVRAAIRKEFFTRSGRLAVDTQTAHVLALKLRLCRPEHTGRTAERLRALLKASEGHLRTGFVGTPYLCAVLCEQGMTEEAYTLLLGEDYPSWLYEVNLGATTIWERWNSLGPDGKVSDTGMNSLNHYAYGSIVEWIAGDLCGLKPLEPGFVRARIAPKADKRLGYAKADVRTAAGLYRCGWRWLEDGQLEIEVEVPFNAEAELCLPNGEIMMLSAGNVVVVTGV